MAKRQRTSPRLSEGELEILQMLWRKQSVTILEAQKALDLPIGYTTVQTRLNRLVKKGVVRKTTQRPARYSAAVTQEEVQAKDLDTLIQRVSKGRVAPLVAYLMAHDAVTPEEIRQVKALIDDAERRDRASAKRKR